MDDDLDHRLHAWVDAYVRAWNSNDPAAIAGLFTPDAAYHTEPYRPPWRAGTRSSAGGWAARTSRARPSSEFTEWWMQHPDRTG